MERGQRASDDLHVERAGFAGGISISEITRNANVRFRFRLKLDFENKIKRTRRGERKKGDIPSTFRLGITVTPANIIRRGIRCPARVWAIVAPARGLGTTRAVAAGPTLAAGKVIIVRLAGKEISCFERGETCFLRSAGLFDRVVKGTVLLLVGYSRARDETRSGGGDRHTPRQCSHTPAQQAWMTAEQQARYRRERSSKRGERGQTRDRDIEAPSQARLRERQISQCCDMIPDSGRVLCNGNQLYSIDKTSPSFGFNLWRERSVLSPCSTARLLIRGSLVSLGDRLRARPDRVSSSKNSIDCQ